MSYPPDPTAFEVSHSKLASAVIIGHMTAHQCKIWVRLYRAATWWLVITKEPLAGDLDTLDGMQVDEFLEANNIKANTLKRRITADTDYTHTFLVRGLESGQRYYYAVIADLSNAGEMPRRTEIGSDQPKYFDSLPRDLSRITFGYYSCHDPFSTATRSEGAWPLFYDTMSERNALFCIGGGDQVYVDTNDKEDMYSVWEWLAKYKNAIITAYSNDGVLEQEQLVTYFSKIYRNYYRIYWNFFNLKQTFERFPQYMIWDDHEIMDGWGSYTKTERRRLLNKLFQDDDEDINDQLIGLMFRAAKHIYLEYQHSHNPNTNVDLSPEENPSCEWDYNFTMGKNVFFVLDMRGHHDYERRQLNNALLGDEQMVRLKEWLQSSTVNKADAAFIVSPVPVVHWGPLVSSLDIGSFKDDLRDEWEHESNRAERNEMLDAVLGYSHTNSTPVTFLSGDVHSASVYALENYETFPKARVFSVTSSAISRKPAPEKAELFMKKTGEITEYNNGYASRLYAMSGEYNFLVVTAEKSGEKTSVVVDLYWPGGDDRETIKKRIHLV